MRRERRKSESEEAEWVRGKKRKREVRRETDGESEEKRVKCEGRKKRRKQG